MLLDFEDWTDFSALCSSGNYRSEEMYDEDFFFSIYLFRNLFGPCIDFASRTNNSKE